jgi:hypothetical protein
MIDMQGSWRHHADFDTCGWRISVRPWSNDWFLDVQYPNFQLVKSEAGDGNGNE